MMKSTKAEICWLFVILTVLCASIWIMNGHKKTVTLATHLDISSSSTEGIGSLSLDAAYEYIFTLFLAHDTYLVVQVISQFTSSQAIELTEKIMKDQKIPLTASERLIILFGVIENFHGKKVVQNQLLDLLLNYPNLYQNTPVLIVLSRSRYTDIISDVLQWINQKEKNEVHRKLVKNFIIDALKFAVDMNDKTSLEILLSKKVRITEKQASELLWDVVRFNKKASLVPFLVRHAQANVNHVGDGKRTLLIKATEQKNKEMVQALLEEGAVVDQIVDPETGSALLIAIENGYTDIELMLREYGAKE